MSSLAPSWRRWTRFSLRTFLLSVTVLAVWFGFQANQARQQERAVVSLKKLEVQVSYAWQHDKSDFASVLTNGTPPTPKWLRGTIGEHFFQRVVRVNCEQSSVSDADLQCLEALPDIRFLSLFDTAVTNACMRHVGKLPELRTLYFFETDIGNEGLKHLRNTTTLSEIQCGRSAITDSGLTHLKNLPRLEKLWLGSTQITDGGVKHLVELSSLRFLDLRGTEVSDDGVAELKKRMPDCKILH